MRTLKGEVIFWDGVRHFGFIRVEGMRDFFFHANDGKIVKVENPLEVSFIDRRPNREPKVGDKIVFHLRPTAREDKAAPWGFLDEPQTPEEMREVIWAVNPGNSLKLTFSRRDFDGDLKGQLYMVMAMNNQAILFGEMPLRSLQSVAETGLWCGFMEYTVTVLSGFDPGYFIDRTVNRELLEHIEIVVE